MNNNITIKNKNASKESAARFANDMAEALYNRFKNAGINITKPEAREYIFTIKKEFIFNDRINMRYGTVKNAILKMPLEKIEELKTRGNRK
jgi:hypothetical protein